MITNDDPRWAQLEGGYRQPFDPRPALRALTVGDAGAFDTLWEELHHQGDVGLASYAAVPALVSIAATGLGDWQAYGLVLTIDLARNSPDNPPIPKWLADDYGRAISLLARNALTVLAGDCSPVLARCALAAVALSKQARGHARLLFEFDEDELRDYLEERLTR